jgi:chemotaxis protein CheX
VRIERGSEDLIIASGEITDLIESTIESVQSVVPLPVTASPACLWNESVLKHELCVAIGITGDIIGKMLIDGPQAAFSKLGECMFGMALEGEMLQSFVGEVANMLAGNMCTVISQRGRSIDITPPRVSIGEVPTEEYTQGVAVPFTIEGVGELHIVLLRKE